VAAPAGTRGGHPVIGRYRSANSARWLRRPQAHRRRRLPAWWHRGRTWLDSFGPGRGRV